MKSDHASRREVLAAGAVGVLHASLPMSVTSAQVQELFTSSSQADACILLNLVGGPSQLETFDPKPDAPSEVRGSFGAIRTNVHGIQVSELLPRTARHADKYAILRAVYHHDAPVHETGLRLWQTGSTAVGEQAHPHIGAVLSARREHTPGEWPGWVVLPHSVTNVGDGSTTGQSAAALGANHQPVTYGGLIGNPSWRESTNLRAEPETLRNAYGNTSFGRNCLIARRLVERGVRCITVNMFTSLVKGSTAQSTTWDAHGTAGRGGIVDCAAKVIPDFDRSFSTLLADLTHRGLLARTLVVAAGEMGRSPRINRHGGRDHWTRCWSVVMAGGGVRGGRAIGTSDARAAEPRDGAIRADELHRLIQNRF